MRRTLSPIFTLEAWLDTEDYQNAGLSSEQIYNILCGIEDPFSGIKLSPRPMDVNSNWIVRLNTTDVLDAKMFVKTIEWYLEDALREM